MHFSQAIKKLNKRQQEAVEAIEGPVMVVAGPGTGKTQILTLRIANILQKTDTSPESILALTFTEAAAGEMRQRLVDLTGGAPEAYRVTIRTIHGFCNELIQEHSHEFPMIAGESNITEVEQLQIVCDLLETSRQRFARDIVSSISELKREGLSPKDVRESAFAEATADKHEELSRLYAAYQKELLRSGRYDYDDMILAVAQVLKKNASLRRMLQEQYLYILVDEHQDTNQSQAQVIELLAGTDTPNLFVVGDAKQAIYRFQGALLDNFTYFRKRFKGARIITLTDNYRSTQTILDAALDVAFHKEPLDARAGSAAKHIHVAACVTSGVEPYVVARHIQERIKSGVQPEHIAVLYRANKEAAPIARYLEKLGVPASVLAGEDALSHPDVQKMIVLLEAVRDFGADYALLPALYLDVCRVQPLDVALLAEEARAQRTRAFSLVRDPKTLQKIIPDSATEVFKLYSALSLWKAKSKSFSMMPMLEDMVRFTGLISAGNVLLGELKRAMLRHRDITLEDFLDQLQIMRDHRIGRPTTGDQRLMAGVQLMTAHKAKGLEFDYVYIIGATAGNWEDRRARNAFRFFKKEKDDAGERNLFYVALTRARKEAVISYGKANADGKEQQPSQFISAIRPELVKSLPVEKYEKAYQKNPAIEFAEAHVVAQDEKAFIKKRFLEKGLTVSAINNYLECPNKFYFLNIVGMAEAPIPKGQAGTAAHAALRFAVERKARGEAITKKQFLDRFAYALSKEPMREVDYREAIKRGEKVLGVYFDQYQKSWSASMKCEYAVDGVELDNITLRGRLDRVDLLGDGRARVIDYKYKKPMTRNEILGKTKNSDGNYYRQLTFYKLLIDEGTKWRMQDGVLDFLEPDPRGRFKSEVFAPSDKEVAELKKEIARVSKEILSGEFKSCGEKECKYCELKKLM